MLNNWLSLFFLFDATSHALPGKSILPLLFIKHLSCPTGQSLPIMFYNWLVSFQLIFTFSSSSQLVLAGSGWF
jgi:hypothetical protein